jgi:hypothetical protein
MPYISYETHGLEIKQGYWKYTAVAYGIIRGRQEKVG